jgi:hypothetical protein
MPASKTVALRAAPELLGKTTRVIVLEPEPANAPETVIQPGKAETAQGQKAEVWMLRLKYAPEAGATSEVDPTE